LKPAENNTVPYEFSYLYLLSTHFILSSYRNSFSFSLSYLFVIKRFR
jgi:hypothetical protein